MKFVSPLLKNAVYPALHYAGWFRRNPLRSRCAVVNYHGVLPADYSSDDPFLDGNLASIANFQRQLRFLKAHYKVISPEHFQRWIQNGEALPPRAVLITCDDGLLNTLTDMLGVLQNESIQCLFFVTGASCLEQPGMLWYEELYHLMRTARNRGSDQLKDTRELLAEPSENFQQWWWNSVRMGSRMDSPARTEWMSVLRTTHGPCALPSEKRWRLLNVHELRQLAEAGMTIGAHTLTHPILSECAEDEARREIENSKTEIERALDRPVWAFAYPFGNPEAMGEREIRLSREAGFSCAFLNTEDGTEQFDPFAFPRNHVTADKSLAELEAHLSGFHARLQRAVRG